MTLFWLAFALAAIVAGFTFLIWDVTVQFKKNARLIARCADHVARQVEDEAWAAFRADARLREQALRDTLASADAMDRLVSLLDEPSRKLEVVA